MKLEKGRTYKNSRGESTLITSTGPVWGDPRFHQQALVNSCTVFAYGADGCAYYGDGKLAGKYVLHSREVGDDPHTNDILEIARRFAQRDLFEEDV